MIDAKLVAELRSKTGAGFMDCKRALESAGGDFENAMEELRKSGALKAAKKSAERDTAEGIIDSYIHSNGKIGALVELQCETDFVARNSDFQKLAHEIAMQVAATDPEYISTDQISADVLESKKQEFAADPSLAGKPADVQEKILDGKLAKWYEESVLMHQPWVKDDSKTIEALVNEAIATLGEKIVIGKFARLDVATSGGRVC